MKRARSLAYAVLAGTTTLVMIAGCSGKPENSPAIRKKFAEMDEVKQSVGSLNAEIVALSSEIQRLNEENSELRSLLPGIDGTPALEKISTLEARLAKVESLAADRVVASVTESSPAPRQQAAAAPAPAAAAPATTDLTTAPIAGASTSAARPPVAAQQEVRAPQPAQPRANSFKQLTQPSQQAAAPSASAPAAPRAAAPKPAPSRGTYHTIEAGETIDAIAAKHNTTADKLLQANHLPKGVRLAKGQRLFIPSN